MWLEVALFIGLLLQPSSIILHLQATSSLPSYVWAFGLLPCPGCCGLRACVSCWATVWVCAEDRAAGSHGNSAACSVRLLTVLRSGRTGLHPHQQRRRGLLSTASPASVSCGGEHPSVCPLAPGVSYFAEMPAPFASGAVCFFLLSAGSCFSVLEIKPHWSLHLQTFSL